MKPLEEIKQSFLVAAWFMFLTFPLMVIRVNTVENLVQWRWANMGLIGVIAFFLSWVWRYMLRRKEAGRKRKESGTEAALPLVQRIGANRVIAIPMVGAAALFVLTFPFLFSMYQTNIMITALIYVVLGLGLNIVVGLAGLLDLGYVAFYAVGAYSYALLNFHYGLRFLDSTAHRCAVGGLLRHYSRVSGPAASGRLPGHRHPGVWGDHSAHLGKLE